MSLEHCCPAANPDLERKFLTIFEYNRK